MIKIINKEGREQSRYELEELSNVLDDIQMNGAKVISTDINLDERLLVITVEVIK